MKQLGVSTSEYMYNVFILFVYPEVSVEGSEDIWFINFYSPFCSHCHDLAPTVRQTGIKCNNLLFPFEITILDNTLYVKETKCYPQC